MSGIEDNQSTSRGHIDTREHANPKIIQTQVQSIMNDISTLSSSQSNNWNYIASSLFS